MGLLDEAGERLEDFGYMHDLSNMKIQCFVFGLPEPSEGDEDEHATKLHETKLELAAGGDATKNLEIVLRWRVVHLRRRMWSFSMKPERGRDGTAAAQRQSLHQRQGR